MTDVYQTTRNKEKTVAELKTSTKALIESDIDMLICEVMYFLKFLFQLVVCGGYCILIDKVERILKGSLDLIPSPSRSCAHLNVLFSLLDIVKKLC